jgi:hypothetical protein
MLVRGGDVAALLVVMVLVGRSMSSWPEIRKWPGKAMGGVSGALCGSLATKELGSTLERLCGIQGEREGESHAQGTNNTP